MCWFATDVHGATLGKGKNDDSLERVRKGDIKGELVVGTCFSSRCLHLTTSILDDIWKAGTYLSSFGLDVAQANWMVKDTHVPRAGRDFIRKTLEDANVACSVRVV